MKRIAFFGHRFIAESEEVRKLIKNILIEKTKQGYGEILVGNHGDFDKIVLSECIKYKQEVNESLEVTLVLSTLSCLGKTKEIWEQEKLYQTITYEIENVYYKNRIIFTNKKMVDNCDLVVCYVNMNRGVSGAKRAVNYAKKQKKKIINLFNMFL